LETQFAGANASDIYIHGNVSLSVFLSLPLRAIHFAASVASDVSYNSLIHKFISSLYCRSFYYR